jgi:hypothetical protein
MALVFRLAVAALHLNGDRRVEQPHESGPSSSESKKDPGACTRVMVLQTSGK